MNKQPDGVDCLMSLLVGVFTKEPGAAERVMAWRAPEWVNQAMGLCDRVDLPEYAPKAHKDYLQSVDEIHLNRLRIYSTPWLAENRAYNQPAQWAQGLEAVNKYFEKGDFDTALDYYLSEGRLPTSGKHAVIFQAGYLALDKCKLNPLPLRLEKLKELRDLVQNRARARATHVRGKRIETDGLDI